MTSKQRTERLRKPTTASLGHRVKRGLITDLVNEGMFTTNDTYDSSQPIPQSQQS